MSFCHIVRVEVETELPGATDPAAGWRVHQTAACRGVRGLFQAMSEATAGFHINVL